jgi:DNA polymerase III subunit delta'
MAEELDDPREVAWHPRLARSVEGQGEAWQRFASAFQSGRPHHAWLLTGHRGIGKATLAYKMAEHVLAASNPIQTARWIASRSHPDLFVLERSFNDSKPRRLRQEIVVDDARQMADFFSRTSGSGGWRVAIVDCADELNSEAANALLKLVEEPPPKALILLVSHRPGRLLRTLRSRCRTLAVAALDTATTCGVVERLPLLQVPSADTLRMAASLSGGSPGRTLELLDSGGARAFEAFLNLKSLGAAAKLSVAGHFGQRQAAVADFETFMELLLDWLAREAAREPAAARGYRLAHAHQKIAADRSVAAGYNLDRRTAVLNALVSIEDALKAA